MDVNNNAEIIERLHEILKDVDDITELSHMDKILMVLDEIRIADDEYMELLILKLKNETITWEQPWYQTSTCLTRKPKITEDGAEAENFETGPFTYDEIRTFNKNWKKLVKMFDIPNTPVRLARWKNRGKSRNHKINPEEFIRSYIIAYLARGLRRNLYQVYQHFLQTYGYPVKSKNYTSSEERVMEICFYHKPQHAVTILSSVLGREPRGIYNKLSHYYNGVPEKKRVTWTLQLAAKFLHHLISYSGCSLDKLRHKQFDLSVWQKVGDEMEHQYKYLQAFWYGKLHVQLFVQCKVQYKTLRRILFNKLLESPYKTWTDIRWKHLVSQFPCGFTHLFLYRTARNIFKKHPGYLTKPLNEVIEYVTTVGERRKRRLKCLQLDDEGNLVCVKYENKLRDLMQS